MAKDCSTDKIHQTIAASVQAGESECTLDPQLFLLVMSEIWQELHDLGYSVDLDLGGGELKQVTVRWGPNSHVVDRPPPQRTVRGIPTGAGIPTGRGL